MKAHYCNLRSLAQIKDLQWKKRQPQNARGSNQRPPMKKEATPKHKGLKSKTSDEKRGNPKMQGAQIKDLQWKMGQSQNARGSNQIPPMKNGAIPKCKGLKSKTFDEKRGNSKCKGLKSKTSDEKRCNPKTQGAQIKDLRWRWFHKPKIINPELTEAILAKLTLEGEGEAFWFHLKCKTLMPNQRKAILQTKNHKLLAHRSQPR
jgi:hypothetical protein